MYEAEDEERREYKPEKKPFFQKHPILSILVGFLVTGALFAVQCWFWSYLLDSYSFWIPVLALLGTVLIVYFVMIKAKHGLLRNLFVIQISPTDDAEVEYPTAYPKKNFRKKTKTPDPDTMSDDAIKKKVKNSPRIQKWLRKREKEE